MSTATYMRVSTGHQTIDQQRDALANANITAEREFVDIASGRANAERPGLAEALSWLREGDQLVVVALDRLGRSARCLT